MSDFRFEVGAGGVELLRAPFAQVQRTEVRQVQTETPKHREASLSDPGSLLGLVAVGAVLNAVIIAGYIDNDRKYKQSRRHETDNHPL